MDFNIDIWIPHATDAMPSVIEFFFGSTQSYDEFHKNEQAKFKEYINTPIWMLSCLDHETHEILRNTKHRDDIEFSQDVINYRKENEFFDKTMKTYRRTNVVSTANLSQRQFLRMSAICSFGTFTKKGFPGNMYKHHRPRATTPSFRSGRLVCIGSGSKDHARLTARIAAHALFIFRKQPLHLSNFVVQNVVTSVTLPSCINLEKLQKMDDTMFEIPEKFPGVVVKFENDDEKKKVGQVFKSGKINITGAKLMGESADNIKSLVPKLIECMTYSYSICKSNYCISLENLLTSILNHKYYEEDNTISMSHPQYLHVLGKFESYNIQIKSTKKREKANKKILREKRKILDKRTRFVSKIKKILKQMIKKKQRFITPTTSYQNDMIGKGLVLTEQRNALVQMIHDRSIFYDGHTFRLDVNPECDDCIYKILGLCHNIIGIDTVISNLQNLSDERSLILTFHSANRNVARDKLQTIIVNKNGNASVINAYSKEEADIIFNEFYHRFAYDHVAEITYSKITLADIASNVQVLFNVQSTTTVNNGFDNEELKEMVNIPECKGKAKSKGRGKAKAKAKDKLIKQTKPKRRVRSTKPNKRMKTSTSQKNTKDKDKPIKLNLFDDDDNMDDI
jgi:transcription initiation factor TFIID TATA-box-binding protein